MARFEITAPDGSRYEITAPDGATEQDAIDYARKQFGTKPPDARPPRSFSPSAPVLSPRDSQQQEEEFKPFDSLTSGPGRYVHTFKNALLPGGSKMSSVIAATDDVLRGAPNRHTGQPISFGDAYHYYNKRFNATEDAIEKDFGVLDAPFRSLGWALGGAALKLPETTIASAQYIPQAQQFLNSVVGSIRPGAAFGASQAGLDSRGQTAGEVLTDTLGGLIGGAVVTPAVPLSVNALGRLGGKLGDAYRYMTGRGQDARENVLNRAAEWKDAGVREFAPALTDNPLMKATSEGGIGSVFGGSLRQSAERSIEDATRLAQGVIRRGTNGAPSSDLGQTLQDELRRALIERSKPGDVIRASPQPDLERITGPVGDTGFMPPRPVVDPVRPRNQQPFRVDPIDPAEVKIDPVRPTHVEPPVPNQKYTRFEDIPTPEHWQKPLAEAQAKFEPIGRQFDDLKGRFIDAAKTHNVTPEQLMEAAGNPMHPVHNLRQRLAESYDRLLSERAKLEAIKQKVDYDRDLVWTDVLRSEDAAFKKKFADDRMRYEAEVQEAQRVAAAETARLRAEELQRMQAQREAEARGKYAADQIRLRAEAEEATRRAQSAADGQWERDIINQPGLNPGVSRESYPTVFDAAYELAGRKTPGIQRNPLGRKGDPEATSLLRVLDELGLEGRRQGFAPGYKPGQLFQETGDWAPHVGKYIDELVGPDVARRLDAYATLRKNNQFPPGIQGLRDLRTAIREAAQLAERPPYPGVPRKDAAAALRRLEGALTEDMYRFMGEGGPAGQAATHLWRGTDRAYADYINDLRKPLSKLFGDRVQPIDAMNTIAKAFIDGDLKLANQFMRVMHEKGDPKFAATAVLAHVTNNAATLREFVEGIGKIPPESRKVLFRGKDGPLMLREIAQIERIGQRLMPYANQMDKGVRVFGNRLDLTNPTNIALGLAAISNFYPALFAAGGAAMVARFMASPRYLSWMTRGAALKTPEAWAKHLQTLIRFADTDKDALGKDIIEAVRSMPAGAANAKPGMMRLGGPKPDVPRGFDPITFSRRAVTDEEREAAEKFRTENAGKPIIRDDPDGNKLDVPWYEALYQDTGILPEQGTVKKKPKWMKEIDDSEAVFSSERVPRDRFIPLPEVFKHAELFKLYPGLADIKVRISKKPERDNAEAFYDIDNKALVFNPQVWKEKDVDGKRELFFHELQHVIDDLDGLPFEKMSESLADTTSHRHDMPEAMRRAKPPSQIYDFKPSQYIWKDEHPDLVDGWRTHAAPVEERAITNRRSKRPPGMMNLGGPDEARDETRGERDSFNVVRDAAIKSGIDVRRASPQEIIDAAWKASPTDAIGEMIDLMARKYNLRRPWDAGNR